MRKLKITFNAPVTLGFVFICFVVYLLVNIDLLDFLPN